MQNINFINLEQHSVELEMHPMKFLFEIDKNQIISAEYEDQITPLNKEASNYLWNFESDIKLGQFIPNVKQYFKEEKYFNYAGNEEKELKKWLFNLGIPFKNKVYFALQPDSGFILTWKMLIKYCSNIFFAHDLIVWDQTFNWGLFYHHDEVFHFGKNLIYNYDMESEKVLRDYKLISEWKEKSKEYKKRK